MHKRLIDGVELAYYTAGNRDARPIIFIHGLTASARDWSLSVGPIAEAGWRVLSPDCPGHGHSSAPKDAAAYALPRVADLLHALARGVGWAPAVIVGNSMGGAIAEEYAIRHPADVIALVLVDSAGGAPASIARGPEHADFVAREFSLGLEKGIAAVWALHQAEGGWADARTFPPEVQAWRKARFCQTSPEGYLYGDRALGARRNTLTDLARLDCKTLVVCAKNETPQLKQISDDLAAAIPGARQATIPRAWHSPQLENAPAFNATLLKFLASV